jgi:hypothetical protein
MRTAISTAVQPQHVRWQAAFTINTYRPVPPFIWHHTFVSDARMTNWHGGSELVLRWCLTAAETGKPKRLASPASEQTPA